MHKSASATRRILIGASVLLLLAVVAVTVYQVFGPPATYREGAINAIRMEEQALPAYPGSLPSWEGTYNGPFHKPALEVGYTLPGACSDIHPYYASIASARGWSLDKSPNPSNLELDSY